MQGVVVEDGFILDVNPASGVLIEKVAHNEKCFTSLCIVVIIILGR